MTAVAEGRPLFEAGSLASGDNSATERTGTQFSRAAKGDVLATILQWMPVISRKVPRCSIRINPSKLRRKQQLLAGIVTVLALIFLFARSFKKIKSMRRASCFYDNSVCDAISEPLSLVR